MFNTLTRAAKLVPLLAVVAIFATTALAQAPSQAQRDAILRRVNRMTKE